MAPGTDAIIIRIAPQLADDAMPVILRHDPHKFEWFTNDRDMVVVVIEEAIGTDLITLRCAALENARRGLRSPPKCKRRAPIRWCRSMGPFGPRWS